jgi:WD40 repeat protein
MKYIFTFLLCMMCMHLANAQSVSLFNIDASGFPVMKAKFYAFDAAGKQQRPTAGEITLTENGTPRVISSINCPPALPPKAISSVLVLDLSVSMGDGLPPTNMDIAKAAARAWINSLPLGASECAVTSFDDANYLNQDFTTDRTKLLDAITPLTPRGGTNYDRALIQPQAGALLVSKKGVHKKIIVLLTDGLGVGNEGLIVAEARRQNCTIHCITVGMPAPQILKNISAQTGGTYAENVTTVQDAEHIYRRILDIAQHDGACELTWTSDAPCAPDERKVEVTWQSAKAQSTYIPPVTALTSLLVSPAFVSFGPQIPGSNTTKTITLYAQNADYTVTGITLANGSAAFTVVNPSFPMTIPAGTSKTISLRFIPSDSVMKYASFDITTNLCNAYLSARGGFKEYPMTNTLQLLQPNGGETFIAGSDTVITWDGVAKSESVAIDYSIDDGFTWKPISTNATGQKHLWKNIPQPASTQCRMRVKQRWASGGEPGERQFSLDEHTSDVFAVSWNPDGTKIATVSDDNTAIVWDATFGTKLLTLTGHTGAIRAVQWSPDGMKLATASDDSTVIIWHAVTGSKLIQLRGHIDNVVDISWCPDGRKIVSASNDKTAIIWNAGSGEYITTLRKHIDAVKSVKWSPDTTKIATGSSDEDAIIWDTSGRELFTLAEHVNDISALDWSPDGTILATAGADAKAILWDAITGLRIFTLSGHRNAVECVRFSPDGTKLATGSFDSTAIIWDVALGLELSRLRGHKDIVYHVSWSPDGTKLATSSLDNNAIIWDVNTEVRLFTLTGHTSWVYAAEWSADGTKVATASKDRTAAVWFVDNIPLQADTSDATFQIVVPMSAAKNINMLQCLVGTSKDSVVASFISNIGSYPCRVDSIYFTGPDAGAFTLVSGLPSYTIASSQSKPAEFRFTPMRVGLHSARIIIVTQSDTYQQTITGTGVTQQLQILNDIIDFGKVVVNSTKDTLGAVTVKNIGSMPLTITNIRHAGPNDVDFRSLNGSSTPTLQPGDTARVDLQFSPKDKGRTGGRLLFEYNGLGSPATVQLYGEGFIRSSITSTQDAAFDSSCIGVKKTILATIINEGSDPMDLLRAEWVTNTGNTFSTPFLLQTLPPDSRVSIPIDFLPVTLGAYSGEVRWVADKDTAYTMVSGIGVKCINTADTILSVVVAKDIVAKAGEEVAVRVMLDKQAKMYLPDAPTTWKVRLHYNTSILHQLTGLPCRGTDDSCSMEFTGVYNPSNDTLVSIPCILTLGATDHSSIIIDEFRWTDGWVTTNIQTQNGDVRLANICEDGGVRLFIPAKNSTSLSTRPNPAQDNLQIHYGLREPLTVTLELLTMTGQVVQTILNTQAQAAGQYTLTGDLSVLGNGVYMLRMRTNKEMLTTRVDVVK